MDRLSKLEFEKAMKLLLPHDKQDPSYIQMMETIYKEDEHYSKWVETSMKRLIADEWKVLKKVDDRVLLPTIYDFDGDVFVFNRINYCRIWLTSKNTLIICSASELEMYEFNLEDELDRRLHISMICPPITEYILSLADNYEKIKS